MGVLLVLVPSLGLAMGLALYVLDLNSPPAAALLTGLAIAVPGIVAARMVQRAADARARQRKAERERDEADTASRAKSTFLANMSHELRNPLNAVVGMTALMLHDELPEKQRRRAESVGKASDQLLALMNDILDLAKIEARHVELEQVDFELAAVAEDVAKSLVGRAQEKGIDLRVLIDADLPWMVRGDPLRLRQIVTNLLNNAIKFTDEGSVTTRLRLLRDPADEPGSLLIEGRVQDTGVGVSSEAKAILFEPFKQAEKSTARRRGGTGLGLTISRELAELMGGGIRVESEPGEGSTFIFTVCLQESDSPRTGLHMLAHLRGQRVLVLDDDGERRDNLCDRLKKWDLEVQSQRPASSERALKAAQAQEAPFGALVLLDGAVPGPASPTPSFVADARTPVVLVSSPGSDPKVEEGLSSPLIHLTHPLAFSDLIEALHRVFGPEEDVSRASLRPNENGAAVAGLVLVAEDNQMNQQVLLGFLEELGYKAVVASNGEEAIEAVQRRGPFDAVLMDCDMPMLDGLGATRRIRVWEEEEQKEHLPIIAVTANAMREDREAALNAGMDDYIAKPVDENQLANTLRRWCGTAPEALREASVPPFGGATQDPSSVLNPAVIGQLRRLETPRRPGFFRHMIGMYQRDSRKYFEGMRSAIESADPEELRRAAHSLKGSSRNVGAFDLANLCQGLEKKPGSAQSRDLEPLAVELERVWHALADAVESHEAGRKDGES